MLFPVRFLTFDAAILRYKTVGASSQVRASLMVVALSLERHDDSCSLFLWLNGCRTPINLICCNGESNA